MRSVGQDATMPDARKSLLIDLIWADHAMVETLAAVHELALPDGWIAAGFVRNRVWDHLHGYAEPTPLNDIDVVYFDPACLEEAVEKRFEATLRERLPDRPWSVKNQARMALINGDPPYRSIADALEHWCETPTPIGVRLRDEARPAADARPAANVWSAADIWPGADVRHAADVRLEVIAPLGLDDLFDLVVRPTPFARGHASKLQQYRRRMAKKNWPRLWPRIRVLNAEPEGRAAR